MAEHSLSRRTLFAAPAIPLIITPVAAIGSPLVRLRHQRDALMAELDATSTENDDVYEAEALRLCDAHDELGRRMIEYPIRYAADARAKLSVVDDLYHSALHRDGHDRVLFNQVLSWLEATL